MLDWLLVVLPLIRQKGRNWDWAHREAYGGLKFAVYCYRTYIKFWAKSRGKTLKGVFDMCWSFKEEERESVGDHIFTAYIDCTPTLTVNITWVHVWVTFNTFCILSQSCVHLCMRVGVFGRTELRQSGHMMRSLARQEALIFILRLHIISICFWIDSFAFAYHASLDECDQYLVCSQKKL